MLAFPSGTRVSVRDLFGSMPVRLKQRAIEVERLGSSRDFNQLTAKIVALLLPWSGEVSVAVQDSCSRRTVSLRAHGIVDWNRSYRITAADIISRTALLLTQACLVEDEGSKHWVPIGATSSGLSVRGCVSLQPVATKRVQFIALGVQPLLNEHHSNFFYEDVNRVFSNSNFGVIEESSLDDDGLPTKTEGFTGKELKARRGIGRWPMFFLQIMLDTEASSVDVDSFLDQRPQNIAVITDLIQVMAYEFLKKHHFRPKSVSALERMKRPKTSSPAPPSRPPAAITTASSGGRPSLEARRSSTNLELRRHVPSPRSKSHIATTEKRTASPFASWSRVKPSVLKDLGPKGTVDALQPPQQPSRRSVVERDPTPNLSSDTTPRTDNPLFGKSGSLLRRPFDDDDGAPVRRPTVTLSDQSFDAQSAAGDGNEMETVIWIDPTTKIKSHIDPRTGFAVRSSASTDMRPVTRPIPRRESGSRAQNASQLCKWKPTPSCHQNTMFLPTEPRVPQVPPVSETLGAEDHGRRGESQDVCGQNQNISVTLEGRISKTALQNAKIFGQVDHKFILAKAVADRSESSTRSAPEPGQMLVLIDQHAADERCRVEELLKAYFIPNPAESSPLMAQIQALDKVIRVDFPRQDGNLLVRFKGHFVHWGIEYEVLPDQGGPQQAPHKVTVEIRALPPSILERCRLEPRLLIDLLRKEIWKLDDKGGRRGGSSSVNARADHDWVTRFHGCPEGILEMIHSRACRSELLVLEPIMQQTNGPQAPSCSMTP